MSFFSVLAKLNPFRTSPPKPEGGEKQSNTLEKQARLLLAEQLAAAQRRMRQMDEDAQEPGIPRSEIDGFLYFGQRLPVQSSNVAAIQYDADKSQLTIEYKDKGKGVGFYDYADVSIREAEALAKAASKGKWVWDVLRIRGTVFGYRKSYVLVDWRGTYTPQWMRSAKARLLHGSIQGEGERSVKQLRELMPQGWQRSARKFGQ